MMRKVNDAPLKIHRTAKPDTDTHHAQTLLGSLLQQLPDHRANRRKASLRSLFPLRLLASQAHDLPAHRHQRRRHLRPTDIYTEHPFAHRCHLLVPSRQVRLNFA
jgi:hypothetical protein